MRVLTKFTHSRDGHLFWLAGHFDVATFSGVIDIIYLLVVSSLRQMYSSRQRMLWHRKNT